MKATDMKATNRIMALTAAVALSCGAPESASDAPVSDPPIEEKQARVAEVGATIMPFDLDSSTHVFAKTPSGGLQQVLSDSRNPDQIDLIRTHLRDEATRFSEGNFHHPEMIHGEDMAGLHELVGGYERISITYREIEFGAEILYATEDSQLVTAIHEWFEAQLADHGDHAQPHG